MSASLLIVDDDAAQRRYIASVLKASGYATREAPNGAAALALLSEPRGRAETGLVLLDLNMPEMDGFEVLTRLRGADNPVPVVVLTSDGSVARAVDAMRAGACDFLVKPVAPERLDVSIRNALARSSLEREVRHLARRAENRLGFDELVAESPAMRAAIAVAQRASRSEIPLLVLGESGTGKEVFARAIHGESARSGAAFIAVNCGALPANLVESILFGHEKGAFTGATSRRAGKFQEASGGTLFLDEVGELPLDAQVKLLRALQTGEIDPVGAPEPVHVDIRLISATNRDLEAMVADGRFREDLYYRLSVLPITLPPLRERREDIRGLAERFLAQSAGSEGSAVRGFAPAAMEAVHAAPWPGNVRQLENAIYRAVVLADRELIGPEDLRLAGPPSAGSGEGGAVPRALASRPGAAPLMEDRFLGPDGHIRRAVDVERALIIAALARYEGRMAEVARRLGIGRSTLYRKIEDFQIEKGAG